MFNSKLKSKFLYYYLKNRSHTTYNPPLWRLKSNNYEFIIGPIPLQEVSDSSDIKVFAKPFVTYLLDGDPKLTIARRNGGPNEGDVVVCKTKSPKTKLQCILFTHRHTWNSLYEDKGCEFTRWDDTSSIDSPSDFGFITVDTDLFSIEMLKNIKQK